MLHCCLRSLFWWRLPNVKAISMIGSDNLQESYTPPTCAQLCSTSWLDLLVFSNSKQPHNCYNANRLIGMKCFNWVRTGPSLHLPARSLKQQDFVMQQTQHVTFPYAMWCNSGNWNSLVIAMSNNFRQDASAAWKQKDSCSLQTRHEVAFASCWPSRCTYCCRVLDLGGMVLEGT